MAQIGQYGTEIHLQQVIWVTFGNNISFARQIFAALIKTHGRCLDNETLRTLMVEVPQMTGYHNVYIQKNYCMNLKTSDKKLLEIYNLIWNKVKQLEIKFRNKTS